jgi:putative addiction module CopG family antidote
MEQDIAKAIESGEYTSVSEVVREGLRLWQQSRARESLAARLLAAEIELGWQEAERGELVDYDLEGSIARVKASLADTR